MKKTLTAQQVIDVIHGSYHIGSKHGLDNMQALLQALGITHRVPVIHVAGTNGKGSTCAMLERILREAGYRTGLYTSPFLQAYPERIRLNGVPLTDELLVKYGNPLAEVHEKLMEQGICATPFELGTALALSVFEGEQVDAAIVEVGLGGRLDPTNVVQPCLCGIAAIGMDHMEFLGDTPEAIAAEKAGIIKHGVPVVCQNAEPGVAAVFARAAQSVAAPLIQLNDSMMKAAECGMRSSRVTLLTDRERTVTIGLPGPHQLKNALTAVALTDALIRMGWKIPERAIADGLANVTWPARLEWNGRYLLDGAHNAQGFGALKAFIDGCLPERPVVLVTGVLRDKLTDEMLALLASLAGRAVTLTLDNPRTMTGEELAVLLTAKNCAAEVAASPEAALHRAEALAGEHGMILCAGSLYLMGELRSALGLDWNV